MVSEVNALSNGFKLSNGMALPAAAFGTYKTDKNGDVILQAIEAGYRYFDTASFYNNEEELGNAVKHSGIRRGEFIIATKLWKSEMGYDAAMRAFEASLKRLGGDYIDIYLIHWPLPEPGYGDWKALDLQTWRALEELYAQGAVRAIGVSNFLPHHLKNITDSCEIKPMIDQIEFHPGYTQEAALDFCRKNEILVQAWSPLARGRIFDDVLIKRLCEKYGCSPARICIRYAVQRGVMPVVKASCRGRMEENLITDAPVISEEDMMKISSMPPSGWSGEHPDRSRMPLNK